MRKCAAAVIAIIVMSMLTAKTPAQASEVDILVSKLVEKNILSPAEAQIILDDTKVHVTKELIQGKAIEAPDWTQRIKFGGDVRFRTQYDSGKGGSTADGTSQNVSNGSGGRMVDQRLRERVRGRAGLEAKVNDYAYAGVRLMGGGTNSNTGNDTLGGTVPVSGVGSTATPFNNAALSEFGKAPVMWDQYWIRLEAPKEYVSKLFCNDLKLWLGKMPNPFQTTELLWDPNINPGGVAVQYVSPDVKFSSLPSFNIYGNIGDFPLDESGTWRADPTLFAGQIGIKSSTFGSCDSSLNIGAAFYDFANMKGKAPTSYSAGTNTRQWAGTATNQLPAQVGVYAYEYNVFDLLAGLDNASFFEYALPNGLYADFIHNTSAPENNGLMLGAYLGKKSPKEKNDWKIRAEWRYIERDALPDFMTDNDWYGFGTQTSLTNGDTVHQNANGYPAQNGTNSKGIVLGAEYKILKNTSFVTKYMWMEPIKSDDQKNPWNEFQFDVTTNF